MTALSECPKCGEQVGWSGNLIHDDEDQVCMEAYCTSDNDCEASWVETYSHVATEFHDDTETIYTSI